MSYYNDEYGFNGVAFVSMDGKQLVNKAYGFQDVAKNIKNDVSTIFQIGSNTKQFTAEVILQLAMEKKLELQDKLSRYFPGYPNGNHITIEQLLNHTSGIYCYTNDSTFLGRIAEPISKSDLFSLFQDKPLGFTPGSQFAYSNSNYILLGYIIEAVTGEKYERVVRERILKPCGMAHSGFDFANLKDNNKATGYSVIQANYSAPSPITDSSLSFAAGALYSTAADMYKWHNALQHYMLLPKKWQEKAYTPNKFGYGYGWFVDSIFQKRIIGHSGGLPGFYTYEMRVTEDNLCILLMQNCLAPAMDNNTICINILKCLYDKNYKIPARKQPIKVQPEQLVQYTGEFTIMPNFSITIRAKGDILYAQGTNQREFALMASEAGNFFSKEVGAEIEFVKNNDGSYNKLILKQGGQKIPGIRK